MTTLTAMQTTVLKSFPFADEPENVKGDLGMSWTDAKDLSEQSGLTVKQVKGVLSSLSKKGLIFADEQGGNGAILQCLSESGCDALIALTESATASDNAETKPSGEKDMTEKNESAAAEEKATARPRLNIEAGTVLAPTDKEPAKGVMSVVVAAFAEKRRTYAEGHGVIKSELTALYAEKPPRSAKWSEAPDEYILGYVKGAIKEGTLSIVA